MKTGLALFSATLLITSSFAQEKMQRIDGLSQVRAVSGDGLTIVGSVFPVSSARAAVWTIGGGVQVLGALPGGETSTALGVNRDGSVIVGQSETGAGRTTAFRWEASTGLVDIGQFPLPFYSRANLVNFDGSVIAGAAEVPFIWTEATGPVALASLPDHYSAEPLGMSDDGDVIVGISYGDDVYSDAVRWTQSVGIERLPLPSYTGNESSAVGVSADGRVVVGYYGITPSSADFRGFRWTEETGAVDLGEGAFGFTVIWPTAVNHDGSVIYGTMSNPTAGGVSQPFRWTEETGIRYFGPSVGYGNWITTASADASVVVGEGYVDPNLISFRWESGSGSIGRSFGAPAVPNSSGSSASILALGSTFLASGNLELVAKDLPAQSVGYFLVSTDRGETPLAGGQGTLLLSGNIGRFRLPSQVQNSGSDGTFRLAVDMESIPVGVGSTAVQRGDTWHFQAWFRDMNPGSTSNFTDGVSVVWQ